MRRPVRDALALAILAFLALGIGALDHVCGRNISLWFLYVLPVSSAAAISGARAGLAFTFLATALIVAVGLDAGHPYPTNAHFFFEVSGYLFTFLIIVALSLGVRERFHKGIGELLPSPKETEQLQRVVAAQHGEPGPRH
jgi:hypothetical protein